MKKILIVLVIAITCYCFGLYVGKQSIIEDNSIKFVWNDDEESIPVDGSIILLEMTDENTVYIGPVN